MREGPGDALSAKCGQTSASLGASLGMAPASLGLLPLWLLLLLRPGLALWSGDCLEAQGRRAQAAAKPSAREAGCHGVCDVLPQSPQGRAYVQKLPSGHGKEHVRRLLHHVQSAKEPRPRTTGKFYFWKQY